MSDFVELRQVLTVTLKWWWLLILSVVAAGAIGYGVSQRQTPIYQATTTLMVGRSIQATELDSRDLTVSEQLALTYANLARRQPILQAVIEELGLNETWRTLKGRVRANPIEGIQLLEITVEANSPKEAQVIADAIARNLILLSPTAPPNREQNQNQSFIRQRLEDLQKNIEVGQHRINDLQVSLDAADSTDQTQEVQGEIDTMQGLLIDWENSYTRLLAFTKSEALPNHLAIIEPALASSNPVRPHILLNTLLAAMVGLCLALGFIFLREQLDDTLKSEDDLKQSLDLAVLGAISHIKGKQCQDKQIGFHDPFCPAAEAYRMIRSNIQFISVDRPTKVLMVTSAIPGEGKSTTVANLGVVMAQAGLKTIIVDADLRRPTQHHIFQIPNLSGLTDLLCSPKQEISPYLRNTRIDNLQILTAGVLPPNPADLLGSQRMGQLLAKLNELADVVIYDSSPLLIAADAAILSNRVDGTVLVIKAGRTHRGTVRQAIAMLRQADARLLGGVLNQVATKGNGYPYYHSTYFTPNGHKPAQLQQNSPTNKNLYGQLR